MQLVGHAFLFLFLPISFPLVFFLPVAHRRIGLSFLSIIWYVLANANNLTGLAHVAVLVFFSVIMAYLPTPRSVRGAKLRTGVWIAVPLLSLLAARLALEYGNGTYTYPTGLLFIVFSSVSFAVDYARGDTLCPRNPLELIGYLLFFPVLTVGPVLRSKQYFDRTEQIGFDPEAFCFGVRRYMLGYIKRLAVAAVLMRAITELMLYAKQDMPLISFLIVLLFSFVSFYFAVSGTADLAVGICAMYGILLPRDRNHLIRGFTPDRAIYGLMLSMQNYFLDYLVRPICHRMSKKRGHVCAVFLLFFATTLAWRTRPEMLLFALPMLICSFLGLLPRVRRFLLSGTPRRAIFVSLSVLLCTPFTLALTLQEPLSVLELTVSAFRVGEYPFYALFGMIRDTRYLILLGLALPLLLPYAYFCRWLRRRNGGRLKGILLACETVLLFVGFIATLIYFAPQFPQYAASGLYYM